MVFCLNDDRSFRGIVTDIRDETNPEVSRLYPFNVILNFINEFGLLPIPDWNLPWKGIEDQVFAVVCPD